MNKGLAKTGKSSSSRVLFEVETRLGLPVRTTAGYWKVITTIKHPSIAGKSAEIRGCLSDPDEIRLSKRDKAVRLFYRKLGRRFLCVVVKQEDKRGFIVTAYMTDKIKEGELIWKK